MFMKERRPIFYDAERVRWRRTRRVLEISGALLALLLAYFFIPAIIFLLVEPFNKNKFVRFHAFQGLFLGLVSIVGHTVLAFIPVLGWFILPFFSLAIFIVAVVGAVKAFQNQKWMIPVIGEMAQKQADAM